MPILIRDAATAFHTVIGLAAISSPVVQIAERDRWMGWETDQFLEQVRAEPTADIAHWLARRIKIQQEEIYVDDLLRDGILQPTDLTAPTSEVIARLRADAERHRQRHHQASTIREVRNIERDAWVDRATTDLFRSKRSAALAETLEIVTLLGAYLSPPTAEGLTKAFSDSKRGHRCVAWYAAHAESGSVPSSPTSPSAAPWHLITRWWQASSWGLWPSHRGC